MRGNVIAVPADDESRANASAEERCERCEH